MATNLTTVVRVPVVTTTLHTGLQGPAGPVGPPGSSEAAQYPAASAVSGHRALKLNAAGQVEYLTTASADAGRFVGISLGAAVQGDPVTVVGSGYIDEPSWAWNPAAPVYLGANGVLTQTVPSAPGDQYLQIIGMPVTPQRLFVSPRDPIALT